MHRIDYALFLEKQYALFFFLNTRKRCFLFRFIVLSGGNVAMTVSNRIVSDQDMLFDRHPCDLSARNTTVSCGY
jgi:hypothetical protein